MSKTQRDEIDELQTRAIDALHAASRALYDLANDFYDDDTSQLEAGHCEERAKIIADLTSRVSAERRERRRLTARFQSGGRG